MSPSRRGDAEGTITSVGRNRWRIITPRGPGRQVVSRTITGSRADARAALKQLIDQIEERRSFNGNMTLERFADEWLADVERSRAAATHDSYDRVFRVHILPAIGMVRLEELNAMHVHRWLREMTAGTRTRQHAFKVLRMALATAVVQRVIQHNPTDGIEAPKHSAAEPDPFTEAEVQTIVNSNPSGRWHLFVRMGFGTAMRQGELLGLQWRDIDSAHATIEVRRQVVEVAGTMRVSEPKSKAARRVVPVPEHLIGELLERRRKSLAIGQAADDSHVFAREDGSIPQRSNFGQRSWRTLLKSCGIRHRGFHQVRHTWATMQISAGTPITLVSAILGHAKVSTTLDIYARWLPSDVERARAVGRKMFG